MTGMTPAARRYAYECIAAMAAYAIVLTLCVFALRGVEATLPRAMLALLPAVPILYFARAMLRFVRDSDELQRRIQLEAFALAALALCLIAFPLGMLVQAGVLAVPAGLALILVAPAFCALYGTCAGLVARRYR